MPEQKQCRSRRGLRRIGGVLPAALLCLAPTLTACTAVNATPRLDVTPSTRADEPAAIRVSGLSSGAPVSLTLRSVDARGLEWTSSATFAADGSGSVDPATTAPTDGSYAGVDAMGLFSSLRPPTSEPQSAASSRIAYRWPGSGPATFDVSVVRNGKTVASERTERTFWTAPPTTVSLTLAHDGFVGTYVEPAGGPRGPAVLALGGSEGGNPQIDAAILAARGIPTLSVAYFGLPGLPSRLSKIPLEYFDAPLRWLRSRPEVDPDRLWILGASRGSEAAALVAVYRPGLVHGLLDLVPAASAGCSYDPAGQVPCPDPAWTRGGKPVVHTSQLNGRDPEPDPRTVIPVEKVDGPVLTLCGGADLVWTSCRFSEEIQARLRAKGFTHPASALAYPDAGHGIGLPMPYYPVPQLPATALPTYGATPLANDLARADAWPKILAFVAAGG